MTSFIAQMRMEWRQQWQRPFVWFALLAYFLLAFSATLEFAYSSSGYSWVNGVDAILTRALILSVLGIVGVAGIMGDAMSRDKAHQTEEMILVSGAGRTSLSLSRFLVCVGIILIIGASFIPGVILASFAPGIAAEKLGPFEISYYLKAYGVFVLPNLFLMASLIYAVSARWQSQTAAFVVALGLIALYVTALMLLGRDAYRHDVFSLYAMLEPFGNIAAAEKSMTWTVVQKNVLFPPFESMLLYNRVGWMAVSLLLIAIGTRAYPLTLIQSVSNKKNKSQKKTSITQLFDKQRELLLMTVWELRALIRQPGILLLMGFAAFSLWWTAASSVTHAFSLPTTDLLVHSTGYYFDKVLILLLVWSAADLIWREKDCHVHELINTLPYSDKNQLLAKTLALVTIVLVFWTLSMLVNIFYQLVNGFYDIQIWLYLTDIYLIKAPYYIWMAVLAIAMQVLVRQRFVAIGLVLLVYLSGNLLDAVGLYHPLYRFAEGSFFWMSPMDGYGHFLWPHIQFLLYWSLFCVALWLVALAGYHRQLDPLPRLQLIKSGLQQGSRKMLLAGSVGAWVIMGGLIFYQTVIQNTWPLLSENKFMAHVEKNYREQWGNTPQPQIVGLQVNIDLYPSHREVVTQGTLTVENFSDQPINELIIFFEPDLNEKIIRLEKLAQRVPTQDGDNVQHWQLHQALEPGQTLSITFKTAAWALPGFKAHAKNDSIKQVSHVEVIGNGTSILNMRLLPAFGYSERLEHKPAWKREEYGLPRQWQPPEATIGDKVAHDTTHFAWVKDMDVTLSTDADQIPLHGGRLVEDKGIVDGRRIIRYKMDGYSRGWSEILSGRYNVYKHENEDIPDVEIYYHPEHDYTLKENAQYLSSAMRYFIEVYGPAQFDTLRMAEASLHYEGFGARGGLAFASEILGWKTDLSRSGGEDIHEYAANYMGMMWWGDQLIAANKPGAKVLAVGLKMWSAALYLHQARESEVSRKIRLQKMMEMYRKRSKLGDEELGFTAEMKNSGMVGAKGKLLIIYLAELIGQQKLEAVLASFIDEYRFKPAPYATIDAFMDHLYRNIDGQYHQALDDVLVNITNWHLEVVNASAKPLANGQWEITAEAKAEMLYTAGLGDETLVDMEMAIPIAAFSGKGFSEADLIKQEFKVLQNGLTTINWIVDEKPLRFGLDPYLYLADPNPYNNVREIDIVE